MTDTSQPKWIWASFLDPTDDCGSFCAPRPHMNGGPPNNDAIKYIRSDIYETQAARIAELEAALITVTDELEEEVTEKYPDYLLKYPQNAQRLKNDMESVLMARALIQYNKEN